MSPRLQTLLGRAGIYYAKRQYMPCGIDWLWDIERLLKGRSPRLVMDVGANVGQTTQQVKERFPQSLVHAFEPIPSTYETMRLALKDLDGVYPHQLALSDRAGTLVMTADPDSPLNHLVEASDGDQSQTVRVKAESLDGFCRAELIDRIDLLKVDAEGADLQVLKGAEGLLRDDRIALLFAEVGFDRSDRGHVHVGDVLDTLAGTRLVPYAFYDYCRLIPPDYTREGLGLVFANVLFVSPSAMAASSL